LKSWKSKGIGPAGDGREFVVVALSPPSRAARLAADDFAWDRCSVKLRETAGGDLTVGLGAKRKTAGRKRASAGKVKFLTVLSAADIKTIKLRAIERGRGVTASEILEEAVAAWLKLNRAAEPRPLEDHVPASDKHQFLSRMDAKLVKQIKVMAIGWKVTASALVREAVADLLNGDEGKKAGDK
jgi:hypothetical protein